MAINFKGEKLKEPEDNVRYSEKKFERQRENGLNNEPEETMMVKLNRKEKNDNMKNKNL